MATRQTGISSIGKFPAKKNAGKKSGGKNKSGLPLINYNKIGGDISYDPVTGEQISLDKFTPTDTTFKYDPVTGEKVQADQLAERFMTAADYSFVDPSKISQEYGDIARQQMRTNADLTSELALKNIETELKGLQSFAPAAAALQRGEIAKDNAFNQAQRLAQLEQGDPRLQADLAAQGDRARAYAEGRLPSGIDDRAYELGVRSRATDAANTGGFGALSLAGRKASELMSAEQRVGLSQYGDQLLTSNIGNRANLLLAPTEYANAGSQISVNPTQSAGQVAQNLMGQANDKTIISSENALANQTQQQQFKTGLEQETRQFNTSLQSQRDINQAQLNLQAQTTNVSTNLQAQEINARNAITSQGQAMQIRSQENQFGQQLSFNLKNANADRTFQAANINAGRALEVATSNRNTRLQIQQTNKQMIFQDMQQKAAEAAANARAAMAARASMANAAMSASAQRESIAANIMMQREGFAFQLQQQQTATDLYRETLNDDRRRQDAGTAGQIIARMPSAISTIGTAAQAGASVFNNFFGSDGSSPAPYDPNAIGQNADGSLIFA